jgi:DNA-binding response OmpR family regulator
LPDRSARILLVDDEQSIQTLLSYPLRKEGYDVVQATDGRQALDRFDEQAFDLVVLDLMLPRLDGLEVCRRLRSRSSVPIIMLTAKSEEIDKVVGLELGADDYITKPFSLREFSSRIKAALRRAEMSRPAETAPDEAPLEVRALRIDFQKRTVRVRGAEAPLTFVEFEILSALARARSRVHARHAARAYLGRLRLPGPEDDRRPHPPPAREARARPQGSRVPVHRTWGGLQVPR